MAHDVFISYSSLDKAAADTVCALLEADGVRCWIAPRDVQAGVSYASCIIDAINASRAMVLIFSNNANSSPQIEREIERAANHRLPILPFRIENVAPEKGLEYFLSTPHWLDAYTPPLDGHVRDLARQLKALLGKSDVIGPRPAEALAPAVVAAPAAGPSGGKRGAPRSLIAAAVVVGVGGVAAAGGTLWWAGQHHPAASSSESAAPSTAALAAASANNGSGSAAVSTTTASSPAAAEVAAASAAAPVHHAAVTPALHARVGVVGHPMAGPRFARRPMLLPPGRRRRGVG